MQTIEGLLDPENFGKYVLEVISWENDADHYQTNIFFIDTLEKLQLSIELMDSCKVLPDDEPYFGEPKNFKVFGLEVSCMEQLASLEAEYYEQLDDDVEYPIGMFGNGMFLETYEEFVGGFQYETSIIRRLESYNIYKLDEQGRLSKIEKTSCQKDETSV